MTARLAGRVALVTGAASGLGLATSLRFHAEGARLILVDWDEPALDAVACDLRAIAVAGDASDSTVAAGAVRAAREQYGALHVLFNNAGIDPLRATSVTGTSEADWDRVMAVNVGSAFLFSKAAIPLMLEGGGGAIVSTASIAGLRPAPDEAAYSASKAALISLTRSIALDYAAHGIRANCICPGFMEMVMTDRRRDLTANQLRQRARRAEAIVPMGRQGTYEEVARTVVFLACEESSYVTGAALAVDGGLALV